MTTDPSPYHGVWLPFVTPFRDGALDEASVKRMVARYAGQADGFVLAATTGEGQALSHEETRRLVELAAEGVAARGGGTRMIMGLSGAVTAHVVDAIRAAEGWPVDGFLVTCPYYVRPSQEGLRLHFEAIADSNGADILIYNIPYRTGVNMGNDTLLRLAERANIVGVKDCCADPEQSRALIRDRPAGFAVLTGEDKEYMAALRSGADGGVLASAHLSPEGFGAMYRLAREGRWDEADALWGGLKAIPELLFAEPNPSALKYCLWRMGVTDSPDLRLPMTPVTAGLAERLDGLVKGL